MGKVVWQYVALRDKIKAMNEAHEKLMEPFVAAQNKLSAVITDHLDKSSVESIKTEFGTAYKSTRYTASLEDPDAFMNFVVSNNKFELLDRRANSTAVQDFVKETGALPPGAKISAMKTVGVRRASS
jgi:hypothetical protein